MHQQEIPVHRETTASVIQDPVSAQLINNISMLDYQTLSKNGDLIMGQVCICSLFHETILI